MIPRPLRFIGDAFTRGRSGAADRCQHHQAAKRTAADKIDLIAGPSLVSAGATKTYIERLKAGRKLAPLYVKTRYQSDRFLLVDGANRLAASKRQGLTEVEVEIL